MKKTTIICDICNTPIAENNKYFKIKIRERNWVKPPDNNDNGAKYNIITKKYICDDCMNKIESSVI